MTLSIRRFLENPLVARQLATSLSPGKLAWVFLLVNVTVILAAAAGFSLAWEQGFYRGIALPHTGRLLHIFVMLGLYGILTILLPLRVAGLIDGMRIGQTLDQLVVTGVSPLRLLFANWALGLFYAAVLLVVALPVVCVCQTLGGVSLKTIVTTYAVLLIYANVILAVTLALSILEREWLTVPLLITTFLVAGLVALVPHDDVLEAFPPALSELFPTRILVRMVDPYAALGLRPEEAKRFFLAPSRLFGATIPLGFYPFLGWGVLVLVSLAYMVVGPLFEFQPGLNTFGIVSPLSRKRRRRGLVRFWPWVLSRRGELAFLYENRPRWYKAWDAPLRALVDLTVFGLLLAALYGGCSFGVLGRYSSGLSVSWGLYALVSLSCVLLGLWTLLRVDSRRRVASWHGLGRRRVRRDALVLTVGVILFSAVLAASYGGLQSAVVAVRASLNPGESEYVAERFESASWILISSNLVAMFNLFLIGRALSWVCPSGATARTLLFGVGFVVLVLSALLYEMVERHDWPGFLSVGAYFSPSVPIDAYDWRGVGSESKAYSRFLFSHTAVFVSCVALLCVFGRRARQPTPAPRPRAPRGAGLACVLAAMLPLSAVAQEGPEARFEPVRLPLEVVEVHRGFDGVLIASDRDFFTIVLKNTASVDIEGKFWLENEGGRTTARPFSIGRSTTQTLRWSRLLRVNDEFLSTPSRLTFADSGGRQVTAEIEPLPRVFRGPATVALSDDGSPPTAWRRALAGAAKNSRLGQIQVLKAKALALPEDVSAYLGVERVILRDFASGRSTPRQRHALYDYVRLGGSVVFCGSLESGDQAEPWTGLLDGLLPIRHLVAGQEFILKRFPGGTDAKLPLSENEPEVPALNWRRVGPGSICHSSIDLVTPQLERKVVNAVGFWEAVDAALPRGRFPWTVIATRRNLTRELSDYRALYALVGFLALYAVCLSSGLVLFFRHRRYRPWRWAATLLLALGTSASVPWVFEGITRSPSHAALDQLDYYAAHSDHGNLGKELRGGPGDVSLRGVTLCSLTIISGGRQDHEFSVEATEVSAMKLGPAFMSYFGGNATVLERLPSDAGSDDAPGNGGQTAGTFSLRTSPWGSAQGLLIAEAPPATLGPATATYNMASRELRVRMTGRPAGLLEPTLARLSLVTYNLPEPNRSSVQPTGKGQSPSPVELTRIPWPAPDFTSGELELRHQFASPDQRRPSTQHSRFWQSRNRVAFRGDRAGMSCPPEGTPRLLLLWSATTENGTVEITGQDLTFEKEVPASTRGSSRTARVIERDGKRYRSSVRRTIALEIPLTIEG